MILKKLYKILLFFFEILLFLYKLPMIFSGYIFSIVIFSYYFLLHNVRIKRYFSPNLIPTNYSHFAAPAILLYVYIYSIKATLQIIHPKSGYPYFYQILMVSIPVYSFLHKKNQLTVSWFLIISSKLHTCWHSLKIILPAILGQALTRLVTVSSMCCHTSTSALSTSSSSRGFTS